MMSCSMVGFFVPELLFMLVVLVVKIGCSVDVVCFVGCIGVFLGLSHGFPRSDYQWPMG